MPIRINLLAEQQAAEEARRKDPVKRAIWIGSALIFLTIVWAVVVHMQLKAQRSEYTNLDADFRKVDEAAKAVRGRQSEVGDIERRIISLERYSTNRVLWGSMLDAFQKSTLENIRFKSITSNQRYITNGPTNFYMTNITVPFTPSPPAWKFWAGPAEATPVLSLASNQFRFITNGPPFTANKIPYTVKMTIVSTNLADSEVRVKAEFAFPALAVEDLDVTISAGDYGNPPGGSIDEFARQLAAIPYFAQRLTAGQNRIRFTERPPNPEPDMTEPGNALFLRFSAKLTFEDRVLTNE